MTQPFHSMLGGSGAYQWMVCAGAPANAHGVGDNESEYAAEGQAAHTLAAWCLKNKQDAWEVIGCVVMGGKVVSEKLVVLEDKTDEQLLADNVYIVTKDMADAVQVYLDYARPLMAKTSLPHIEQFFALPEIHPLFAGQSDLTVHQAAIRTFEVVDYKHGIGVVVWPENNAQLKYYGVGALTDLDFWEVVDKIRLTIVQPRGWADPIRTWETTPAHLAEWRDTKLIPAMNLSQWIIEQRQAGNLTEEDMHRLDMLIWGEHCRFCAARFRKCAALVDAWEELETMTKKLESIGAGEFTNAEVGRYLDLFEVIKIAKAAMGKVGFARLSANAKVPNWKLVAKKSNRVWKEGADNKLDERYGDDAYEVKLLSPAQIEKLPEGEKYAAQYAFKPDTGLALAQASEHRPAINKDVKSKFTPKTGKKK